MVDLAGFVESHLVGIAVSEQQKQVRLSLRRQDAEIFTLVADGVDRLIVNEFRETNIVDRILLWDSTSASTEYQEMLAELVSGVETSQRGEVWQPIVENEVRSIKRGDKLLLEIEPVYGASVALLAARLAWSPIP